ncbi:threonine synthase [Pelistega sp. MC2]|uniref:threonine synthase n=1 Tax=Pelistega sp. MC2 TaxID=1720297 RepID=UPI0008D8EC2B|nr:threonine synthase [Pelistega sp. MC2]
MKYVSTRGGGQAVNFSDILLEGLARDGGLAMPEIMPQVSADMLEQWRQLSYADLATEVLSLFITDIPKDDLHQLAHKSYNKQAFGSDEIVPIKKLDDQISLVGLSEGPTLAFKDMAMQFLGNIFEYVLAKRGATLNILGATSGDTGSAAEYALRGKKGIKVFMLSPFGRMSEFQRAQMYSLQDENIFNLSVKGVFDECQDIVKALGNDLAFKEHYHLGAVNSINFGRISAQVVYYFWAWLRVTSQSDEQVSFTVPSGNFGNILSGHIARMMGLPIRHLVVATNENNVLEEFFRTGIYRPRSAANTYATSSPSMDISKASNFERFIYHLLDSDGTKVKALWDSLAQQGEFDLSTMKPLFEEKYGFVAGMSTHADRLATIKHEFEQHGYLMDPHTADGVKVAREHLEEGVKMLVLETALPAKFTETIQEAIGQPAPIPEHLKGLKNLPQRVDVVDCDVEVVRKYMQERI